MAIPATYFDPDPDTGQSQADRDLGRMKELAQRIAQMFYDIQAGVTRSGEPLTAGQKTNIRARYASWRTDVQTWFGGLPTP